MENLGMGAFGDDIEFNVDGNPFGADDAQNDDNDNNDPDVDPNSNDDGQNSDQIQDDLNHDSEDVDPDTVANDDNDDTNEGDENDSPNLFSSVATVLHEQGLLPSLDIDNNEIKSPEDLANAFSSQVEDLVKTKLVDKVGEKAYEYLVNGVPLETVQEFTANDEFLNNITENDLQGDLDLSRKIIYQDYINEGMSEDRATRLVARASEAGDHIIVEDAIDAISRIKAFNESYIENQKQSNIESETAAAKLRSENEIKLKNSVYGVKELLKDQPISDAVKEKVYTSMTKVIGKSPDGIDENQLMRDRRENPVDFDTKLYYMYELTKGFTDFSKLTKAGKSAAVLEMEKAIKTNTRTGGGTNSFSNQDNTYLNLGDEIVL